MKLINEKGFSLIELMIAMAVSLIVMAAVYGVFISTNHSSTVQKASAAAMQSARGAMTLMAQDIRMAGYYVNGVANGIDLDSDDEITVRYKLEEIGGIDEITYSFNETTNTIERVFGGDEPIEIIDNVKDLRFELIHDDTVRIFLEIQEPSGRGTFVNRTLESKVKARNINL